MKRELLRILTMTALLGALAGPVSTAHAEDLEDRLDVATMVVAPVVVVSQETAPASLDDAGPNAETAAPAAAPEVPLVQEETTDVGMVMDMASAFKTAKYLVAFGSLCLILVRLFRSGFMFVPPLSDLVFRTRWFSSTKLGGYALALGVAMLMTVGVTLKAGGGFSWDLLAAMLTAAWTAIGQHTTAKDVSSSG